MNSLSPIQPPPPLPKKMVSPQISCQIIFGDRKYMRRIVHDLLGSVHHHHYRGSTSDESDSVEQIGGLPPLSSSTTSAPRRSYYTDEQVEIALDLLSINSLADLGRQNFSSFGKKQSWIQLANGCIGRLATDLLMLEDVGETAERCILLHHRLESRRAARIRTPNEAQNAIQNLYTCSKTVRDVWLLSVGRKVADVERTVGKVQSLMPTWRAVSALAAMATPETERLVAIVRKALSNVLQSKEVNEHVKNMARRSLLQWGGGPKASTTMVTGTKVSFDSDDE